jgi:hypothetical protein
MGQFKFTGAQAGVTIAATAATFIPVVGPVLGPVIGAIGSLFSPQQKQKLPRGHAGFMLPVGPTTVKKVLDALGNTTDFWTFFYSKTGKLPVGGFMLSSGGVKGHVEQTKGLVPQVRQAAIQLRDAVWQTISSAPPAIQQAILNYDLKIPIRGSLPDWPTSTSKNFSPHLMSTSQNIGSAIQIALDSTAKKLFKAVETVAAQTQAGTTAQVPASAIPQTPAPTTTTLPTLPATTTPAIAPLPYIPTAPGTPSLPMVPGSEVSTQAVVEAGFGNWGLILLLGLAIPLLFMGGGKQPRRKKGKR